MSRYVAPPGYDVVAPDWDSQLRRPLLLRCGRCAALLLGAGDTARHDEWHDGLPVGTRVAPVAPGP